MTADEYPDAYTDPGSGVMFNLLGIADRDELARAEYDIVAHRRTILPQAPIRPTGDLDELCAIHHWLFQDVYAWAGQIRTVDIRKSVPGAQPFLPVSMIRQSAIYIAQELRDDRMLRDLGRTEFIEKLAHHYDQWNYLHPFREGNGRTQRAFWDRIAREAGWGLDWTGITQLINDRASRAAAEDSDIGPMQAMFDKVVSRTCSRRTFVPDSLAFSPDGANL